jgi:peptidoglycan/LPS O-acetylase OafA/YrhL
MKRIEFLDGLRGIAIIAVVLYHAYDRYEPVDGPGIHLFRFGFLGVSLFFLISGFVILLSLERTKNYFVFLFHRWRRLFPAMLVATFLVYFSAQWLSERPRGIPHAQDVIPGLFFIDPHYLNVFFKNTFSSLEGSFWSLYVEVKFYFMFGALFFLLGRTKSVMGLATLYLIYLISWIISPFAAGKLHTLLGIQHACWFAGGCCMYLFYIGRELKYLLFCVFVCLAEIIRAVFDIHFEFQWIAQLLTLGLFISTVYFEAVQKLVSGKFLLFFGFISYPLYLIHENAVIAIGIKLNSFFNGSVSPKLIPLIPIGGLIIISYLIAKFAEPTLKKLIDKFPIIS